MRIKFIEGYLSAAMRKYPRAEKSKAVFSSDVFYKSGFGYLGIGQSDEHGRSAVIFQDQVQISFGTVVPVKRWLSGIVEYHSTFFMEKPKRDTIVHVAPGFRLGRPDGMHLSAGVDFAVSGPVPDNTFMIRLNIPSLSPRAMKERIKEKLIPVTAPRSQNSLVAVSDFSKSDIRYLYESEMKAAFHKKFNAMNIMEVVPDSKVTKAFQQKELVPLKDTPERFGVRLGANCLINTDISEYSITRKSSFAIPLLIGFPKSVFSLSAHTSVTDLVTGETRDLGVIYASVIRSRGVNYFPTGASSDIAYLSGPERRLMEKRLIENWVNNFNDVILQNLETFGWEPKSTKIRGEEEISG